MNLPPPHGWWVVGNERAHDFIDGELRCGDRSLSPQLLIRKFNVAKDIGRIPLCEECRAGLLRAIGLGARR